MTGTNTGRFARILVALVLLVGVPSSAAVIQDDTERAYLPDGAWLATGTFGGARIPYMDTYISYGNAHGTKGSVLCTLPFGSLDLPLGPGGAWISVIGTQSGHGEWMRVSKNVFAFTVWRILVDSDGHAVGWARFWGTNQVDAPDHFSGTMNALFYTKELVPLPMPPLTATTEATRIVVENQ
ncbi:MAG TPA: hypothetical protein VK886_14250 [Vicinamibacterales bacterium]|nr:hypothetical protein [Vicinamibacterales bacterium]